MTIQNPRINIRRIIGLASLILFFNGAVALACPQGGPMPQAPLSSMKLTLDLGQESRSLAVLNAVLPILLADSDEAESPLSNALSLARGSESDRVKEGVAILLNHLDRPETSLVLLSESEDGRGFRPERGESLAENWVFSLLIPSLSDHIYWVVIPRNPQSGQTGYVYGFN